MKQLKSPVLVVSYDLWPGIRVGLFSVRKVDK